MLAETFLGVEMYLPDYIAGGMNVMAQNASFAGAGAGGAEPAATPIGQIGVRAQISVVFDLVTRPR